MGQKEKLIARLLSHPMDYQIKQVIDVLKQEGLI